MTFLDLLPLLPPEHPKLSIQSSCLMDKWSRVQKSEGLGRPLRVKVHF